MVLAVVVLVAAACVGEEAAIEETTTTTAPPATTTTAAPTTTTTGAPGELLVWADELRAPIVEAVALEFTDETGVIVDVEIIDFGQIREDVGVAGPEGEGPDIFVGDHRWTGELAVAGVIEPIDLGAKTAEFFDVGIAAFTFEGSTFGVPDVLEAIAMYFNTDLVTEAPMAFEDIEAICEELADIEACVGVPGGDDGDLYFHYPFVSAFGGYIFGFDSSSGYDPSDVGLDTEASVAGVQFLSDQVAAGVVASTSYDDARRLFFEGKQAFWIAGPWERGDLEAQMGVNWGVAKLPTIGGNPPAPFVVAQGFFLSAFSENKLMAQSLLLDFMATPEVGAALRKADRRGPALKEVASQLADDPIAQVFAFSAVDGNPIPNILEWGSAWRPLNENLLLIRTGEATAADAMAAAAEALRAELGG